MRLSNLLYIFLSFGAFCASQLRAEVEGARERPADNKSGSDEENTGRVDGLEKSPKDISAKDAPLVRIKPENVDVHKSKKGVRGLLGDDALHERAMWGLSESGFSTRTDVRTTEGEVLSVADLASRSPGVREMDLGGVASLSIRGGAGNQTYLIVDGVPWSQLASASQDIANLDLRNYSRMTVHRGAGQSALYSGGIGGTLVLETSLTEASTKQFRFNGSVGSFGWRKIGFRWTRGEAEHELKWSVASQYSSDEGNFSFFNDNGTKLNLEDDFLSIRENNSRERVAISVRGHKTMSDQRSFYGGVRGLVRRQSLPGSTQNPAQDASLTTVHPLLDIGFKSHSSDTSGFGANGFLSLEWSRYRDLKNEIGLLAQDQRYMTFSLGSSAFWKKRWTSAMSSHSRIEYRFDRYTEDNFERKELPKSTGQRHSIGLSFLPTLSWFDNTLLLQAGARWDLISTTPTSDRFDSSVQPSTRNESLPSPRISLLFKAHDWLSFKLNGGRYARAATFLELFGDRGFFLGNPSLNSEKGWLADGGVVFASPLALWGFDRLYFESALFAVSNEDTIVYTSQNGFVSQALNLDGASLVGVENAFSFRFLGKFTGNATHTALKTKNRSESFPGKKLPNRPEHQWFLRGDWADVLKGVFVNVFVSLTWVSGNFLDRANVFELPQRQLLDSGIKLGIKEDWLLSMQMTNVLDKRIENIPLVPSPRPDLQTIPRALADTYGFPLPGRGFYISSEYNY